MVAAVRLAVDWTQDSASVAAAGLDHARSLLVAPALAVVAARAGSSSCGVRYLCAVVEAEFAQPALARRTYSLNPRHKGGPFAAPVEAMTPLVKP